MTRWYPERAPGRSAKAMIAVTLLALLLVAAVPLALLAAVVLMIAGHVVGGLALFGGTVLAAAVAVALAGMSGMRQLRKLLSGSSFRAVRPDGSQQRDRHGRHQQQREQRHGDHDLGRTAGRPLRGPTGHHSHLSRTGARQGPGPPRQHDMTCP